MKAIIGDDGSPSAGLAVSLAGALPWPIDTELRVVRVGRGDPRELDDAVSALSAPGRLVRTTLATGRPATVLRKLAAEDEADLLILGSRGFSPIRSLLLGSVSAELVENAPCSVLVARGAGHERLVVGTDGSPAATAMPRTICAWELFRGWQAIVVGVAGDVGHDDSPDRAELALATRRLAARLGTCGLETSDRVLGGDPATSLIDVARSEGADLLVLGPRGRSRVTELLLGSVARKVVQHADCSVLIVRGETP